MVGTAVTVQTRRGDNLAILRAYDFCRPGDVMVVDAGGDVSNALVGGIMTLGATSLGLAGMVLDGAIRDVAEIRQRSFPVYARGVTHRGPYKDGPGAINVPITVGGMPVNRGRHHRRGSGRAPRIPTVPGCNGHRESTGSGAKGTRYHPRNP